MKALNSCLSSLHNKKNQSKQHPLLITYSSFIFIFIFISHQLHQMMTSESRVPAKPESGSSKVGHLRPPEQNPKCPRCDSPNTKFCYYNNYSLSQPRHFCKTCRRYWTRGGALRNVPIGGGCRKNKKIKSNSKLFYDPKLSNNPSMEFNQLGGGAIQHIGTSSIITTTNSPSLSLNPTCYNVDMSVAGSSSLMGFNNYYGNSVPQQSGESRSLIMNAGAHQEMASMNFNTNNILASSIESLSCINQDLHWKLQQQRIGLLLHEENQKEPGALFENQLVRKPDPIGFGDNTTSTHQWVFDNSFNPITNTLCITPNNNNININYSGSGGGNTSNWSGIQGWNTELSQHDCISKQR